MNTRLPSGGSGAVQRLRAKQRRLDETGGLGVVLENDYALIPLLHGKFAKIDIEDIECVNAYFWTCDCYGYAISSSAGERLWMHRFIMCCPDELEVDHRYGDRLDNRKGELRICNHVQQQGNRWKSKHAKTSKFKGVHFCKRDQHFAAYGREGSRNKRLGTFSDERDAALAYNKWATVYFGEFAKLNPL